MNAGPGPEAEPFNIPPVCKPGAHLSKGSRFQGVSYCSKGCSRGIQRDMGWRYLRISKTALPRGKQDIVGTWVKRKTILITSHHSFSCCDESGALQASSQPWSPLYREGEEPQVTEVGAGTPPSQRGGT